MNGVIVLFGATGDLARRKIIPALYYLFAEKKMTECVIICVGFEASASVHSLLEGARHAIGTVDKAILEELAARMIFYQMDVTNSTDFVRLRELVEDAEHKFSLSGNRLFYIALSSYFFIPVSVSLAQNNLARRMQPGSNFWHRIVYEKPFGNDLASAVSINQTVDALFDESQLFRMDHYLTKELVSNIALVRFTNAIFRPLWNNKYIEQIQIILDETMGIDGRGAYYDTHGALSDVVQNHMLQLLALVAMQQPEKLTSHFIQNQRVAVLKKVRVVDGILGQYDGYHDEAYVQQNSQTETFALLHLAIDNDTWQGVPFILRTGKALAHGSVAIHIKFRATECLLTQGCPIDANWLTFTISPEAIFSLQLNVKQPDHHMSLMPVDMAFCHSCVFPARAFQAYEILLQEVFEGHQASAVRCDEIEAAWRIIDAIKQAHLPLYQYSKGSDGPHQMIQYTQQHAITWHKNNIKV